MFAQSAAYPCLYEQTTSQSFFTSKSDELFGEVVGKLSNCRLESYFCGETCTNDRYGSNCTPIYCTREVVDQHPEYYVNIALELIERHGFSRTSWVPTQPTHRVPNFRIEKNLWVSVFVNQFNQTEISVPMEGQALDDMSERAVQGGQPVSESKANQQILAAKPVSTSAVYPALFSLYNII